MDFADRLKDLARKIPAQLEHISTEEATKNALVMPFIAALGYNVFDPLEVVPEFTADVGTKKGEKVDYAVFMEGRPIILFECKAADVDLVDAHASQLFRYFTTTDGRFGVLTNGIVYKFFSDLDKANRMDSKPFLQVDLLDLRDQAVEELKKFAKASYDEDAIIANANQLKYTREIKRVLAEEWKLPSDDFVRFIAGRVYPGRMTQAVREEFTGLTKNALSEFLHERVSDRLKSALKSEVDADKERAEEDDVAEQEEEDAVVTTEEELEAFYIVKAILRETTDSTRIFMRDQRSYCGILLDNNNRRPICRLWFNTAQKYIGTFDAEKNETRHPIEGLDDIYKHASELAAAVFNYDKE